MIMFVCLLYQMLSTFSFSIYSGHLPVAIKASILKISLTASKSGFKILTWSLLPTPFPHSYCHLFPLPTKPPQISLPYIYITPQAPWLISRPLGLLSPVKFVPHKPLMITATFLLWRIYNHGGSNGSQQLKQTKKSIFRAFVRLRGFFLILSMGGSEMVERGSQEELKESNKQRFEKRRGSGISNQWRQGTGVRGMQIVGKSQIIQGGIIRITFQVATAKSGEREFLFTDETKDYLKITEKIFLLFTNGFSFHTVHTEMRFEITIPDIPHVDIFIFWFFFSQKGLASFCEFPHLCFINHSLYNRGFLFANNRLGPINEEINFSIIDWFLICLNWLLNFDTTPQKSLVRSDCKQRSASRKGGASTRASSMLVARNQHTDTHGASLSAGLVWNTSNPGVQPHCLELNLCEKIINLPQIYFNIPYILNCPIQRWIHVEHPYISSTINYLSHHEINLDILGICELLYTGSNTVEAQVQKPNYNLSKLCSHPPVTHLPKKRQQVKLALLGTKGPFLPSKAMCAHCFCFGSGTFSTHSSKQPGKKSKVSTDTLILSKHIHFILPFGLTPVYPFSPLQIFPCSSCLSQLLLCLLSPFRFKIFLGMVFLSLSTSEASLNHPGKHHKTFNYFIKLQPFYKTNHTSSLSQFSCHYISLSTTICILLFTSSKKLAQLPAVEMQRVPGSCSCYFKLSPRLIPPCFDSHSLFRLHSVGKMWSLDVILARACCMSTSGRILILVIFITHKSHNMLSYIQPIPVCFAVYQLVFNLHGVKTCLFTSIFYFVSHNKNSQDNPRTPEPQTFLPLPITDHSSNIKSNQLHTQKTHNLIAHTAKINLLNCLQLTSRKSQKVSFFTPSILQQGFNQALMHTWLEHAACLIESIRDIVFPQSLLIFLFIDFKPPHLLEQQRSSLSHLDNSTYKCEILSLLSRFQFTHTLVLEFSECCLPACFPFLRINLLVSLSPLICCSHI
ncbi:putative signal peptide protein [Puccinia sorghi]|uniref:Putative signal peptide protein n=1 Tax=Puccinia sorghi TaxID=27349 RepID=A0A0L6VHD7_9BASI|nr:putative signal peptide protein [Puccinia sorghi]